MYQVFWQSPVITGFFGLPAETFRPAASILCYGISDYRLMMGSHPDPVAAALARASSTALLGTPAPDDELLKAVSPALHVTRDSPPTFIFATADDSLVPAENSARMATALAAAGIPFEIHVFEKGMHGLSLADQSTAGSRMETDPDAAKWVGLAEAWLQKRLALPLLDKPFWMKDIQP